MACREPGLMGMWLKPVGLPQHRLAHFVNLLLAQIGGLRPLPDMRFRFLQVSYQVLMVFERLQVEVTEPPFLFHASFFLVNCPPRQNLFKPANNCHPLSAAFQRRTTPVVFGVRPRPVTSIAFQKSSL